LPIVQALGAAQNQMSGCLHATPMKTVLPVAAKEAIRVAQKLLANERIGICAHHDGSRLITWGPTDHIGLRCIPGHDRDAPAVRLAAIRPLLPVSMLGVSRGTEEHPES
jgi:hypothetical protein